ncbi:MAG: alpha/beta fold hydrolase [Terrimesophilobacter sp.]
MADPRRHAVACSLRGAAALAATLAASAALAFGLVTFHFAKTVVTVPRKRPDDVRVLAFDGDTITLSATPDSVLEGRYGFWFAGSTGHARLGEVESRTGRTVTRHVLAVDVGDLSQARRGRMGGWYFLRPDDLELPFEDVVVPTPVGNAPAWLIPAPGDGRRWVIQVHGRAVTRDEALRAVPVFHAGGYTSLLISYRNDGVAPSSVDARYALGDTEWEDVAAAVEFARDRGAREVIIMGWSMGGAIALQTVTRLTPDLVRGIVLDSPVIDWVDALDFHAAQLKLPRLVTRGVYRLIGSVWGSRLTGQAQPINLDRLDFVRRSTELSLPILLMHSDDDGYIPPAPSRALASARPDIVTFEAFHDARHTKLWNYDQERWNAAIRQWLGALETSTAHTAHPTRQPEAAPD